MYHEVEEAKLAAAADAAKAKVVAHKRQNLDGASASVSTPAGVPAPQYSPTIYRRFDSPQSDIGSRLSSEETPCLLTRTEVIYETIYHVSFQCGFVSIHQYFIGLFYLILSS